MTRSAYKRNARARRAWALGWVLSGLWLFSLSCTRTLAVDVELVYAESPDPFTGVATVRMRGLVQGQVVLVGEDRWDQGPIRLPNLIDPGVSRLVIEGLSEDGEIVSSGASGPLDLLREPPEAPLQIFFSRVGELSVMPERAPARSGGRAIALSDGDLLFLGGVDAQGCPIMSTERYRLGLPAIEGPRLPEGRHLGTEPPLSVLTLPSGAILVIADRSEARCGHEAQPPQIALWEPPSDRFSVLSVSDSAPFGAGVQAVAVTDSLVLVSGGASPVPQAAVYRVEPRSALVQPIGSLESPRSDAGAARISNKRVAFVGGQSTPSSQSALSSVTIFEPDRGSTLSERVALGSAVVRPAVIKSRAGAVIVAGGRGPNQAGQLDVQSVVVRTEQVIPLGDTSTVTTLTASVAEGALIELRDSSLVFLPEGDDPLHWIQLLPDRSDPLALPEGVQGPLIGGPLPDGSALLRAGDGRTLLFNPGLGAALGLAMTQGSLQAPQALGLAPLRPRAWRFREGLGLEGRAPQNLGGQLVPEELAVLQAEPVFDFELSFTLRFEGLSKAAILFGLNEDEYDYAILHGAAAFARSAAGQRARGPINCAASETRVLAQGGPHRLRVRRTGTRLSIDVGADGTDEVLCEAEQPELGFVALGVVSGVAIFDDVQLSAP